MATETNERMKEKIFMLKGVIRAQQPKKYKKKQPKGSDGDRDSDYDWEGIKQAWNPII